MKRPLTYIAAGVGAVLVVAYSKLLSPLFSSNYPPPRRYSYLPQSGLVWTNIATHGLIAIAYAAIFACLLWLALRLRKLPEMRQYRWVFLSFVAFLATCALNNLLSIVTLWWPVYPFSTAIRVVCAVVSIPCVVVFAQRSPLIAAGIRNLVETLSTTQHQRDAAESALIAHEKLVSAQEHTTRELAQAYVQLNAVLECTTDSVVTIGHDWTLLYGNRKAIDSLHDFKLGKSYWECFPTMRDTPEGDLLRLAMEHNEKVAYEIFFPPTRRWYKAEAFPSPLGLSLFFSDINEEKTMQAQLTLEQESREQRIEALSHMAGGLAHEISNPLAIIHARASDLLYSATTNPAVPAFVVRTACDSIIKTSDRAIRILRGLKGFGREATNDPKELASIGNIVDQCLELQQSRFDRHNIELRVLLNPSLPLILCRETQIGQILNNLLNNAFDAVELSVTLQRWVSLTADCDGADIHIEVTDSGLGIPEADKAHLMEPFFTTKEVGKGTGIGLSLSRAIAIEHGGTLTLCDESEHTCFRLVLPIVLPTQNHETEHVVVGEPV